LCNSYIVLQECIISHSTCSLAKDIYRPCLPL